MTATMTSKGQITVPVKIRRKLKLAAGSVLQFDEDAPFLKARQVFDEKKARAVLGCAKNALPGETAQSWLSATRARRVKLGK
jgi:AbrB family looped-hinge helix DNA binding protein